MASQFTVVLRIKLTLVLFLLIKIIITNAENEDVKNQIVDMVTQIKVDNHVKESSTFNNQTKSDFVPSFHLGPIKTFSDSTNNLNKKLSTSPFNGQEDMQFVNERSNSLFNTVRPIKFENSNNDYNKSEKSQNHVPVDLLNKNENIIKFVDDKREHEEDKNIKDQNIIKLNHRHSHTPTRFDYIEYPDTQQSEEGPYINENYGTGQQYVTYEIKPSKFHEPYINSGPYQQGDNHYVQYQSAQFETLQPNEKFNKPGTVINVHPMSYQTTSFDLHSKPKTVVYITSHDTMPTKKIPYQYHQPFMIEQTDDPIVPVEAQTEPHQNPVFFESQDKGIITWKKIFHIIGAFLPLGLLFALLSPKVINAGQNPDPNIVLSKLRNNDLPAEHKQTRLLLRDDNKNECVKQLFCQLLSTANPTNTKFLQHLILQVTLWTPELAVRKKELEKIFEEAKLRNCDILTCNFYDGT